MSATYRTLLEQRDALAAGEVSSRELVELSLSGQRRSGVEASADR